MKLCMKMPPDAETVLLQQQETAGDDSCRPDWANNEIIGPNLNERLCVHAQVVFSHCLGERALACTARTTPVLDPPTERLQSR